MLADLQYSELVPEGSMLQNVKVVYLIAAPSISVPAPARTVNIVKVLNRLDWLADNNPQLFHNALQAFDLTGKIESLEHRRAASFFTPENLERVGRRERFPDFVEKLVAMRDNPWAYGDREKLKMLQFISNAYNDHIGAPRTTVKLYEGEPNEQGFYKPGGSTIHINKDSQAFSSDFAALINTIAHENTHNLQDNPNIYSNPILSRIYRANFRAYQNAQGHGYEAYRFQPVEAGAFAAGNTAEQMVRTLAANDNCFRPAATRPIWDYRLAA